MARQGVALDGAGRRVGELASQEVAGDEERDAEGEEEEQPIAVMKGPPGAFYLAYT